MGTASSLRPGRRRRPGWPHGHGTLTGSAPSC